MSNTFKNPQSNKIKQSIKEGEKKNKENVFSE